ncbi:unnamed protein product [Camellia sinensis]
MNQIRHGNMANQTRKMNRKCINYGIGYLSIRAKVGRDEYYMVVAGTFCDIAQQSRSHPTSLFLQRDNCTEVTQCPSDYRSLGGGTVSKTTTEESSNEELHPGNWKLLNINTRRASMERITRKYSLLLLLHFFFFVVL